MRAFASKEEFLMRNPESIRPWQHLFDPLFGYITLAEKLNNHSSDFQDSYNFGPDTNCQRSVGWIADYLTKFFDVSILNEKLMEPYFHESKIIP